jgi:hypothetical protein
MMVRTISAGIGGAVVVAVIDKRGIWWNCKTCGELTYSCSTDVRNCPRRDVAAHPGGGQCRALHIRGRPGPIQHFQVFQDGAGRGPKKHRAPEPGEGTRIAVSILQHPPTSPICTRRTWPSMSPQRDWQARPSTPLPTVSLPTPGLAAIRHPALRYVPPLPRVGRPGSRAHRVDWACGHLAAVGRLERGEPTSFPRPRRSCSDPPNL